MILSATLMLELTCWWSWETWSS